MLLNSNEIQAIIPHRYPFLLIDQILEMEENGARVVAKKNVSANEMQFMGHFPQEHVMPGVLIVEALAQTGAVGILSREANKGKIAYFAGIDKCRFKGKVIPGDTLILEINLIKEKGPIGVASAKATVDGKVVVQCEITFAVGK